MNERIKELRKTLGLTQQEFADKIGVKRNTIAQYEIGRNPPIEAVINSICREFHVNGSWLRDGTGEMFEMRSQEEELAAFFGDVLSGAPDFRRRLISALARLDEDQWATLADIAQKLVEEMQKEKPAP